MMRVVVVVVVVVVVLLVAVVVLLLADVSGQARLGQVVVVVEVAVVAVVVVVVVLVVEGVRVEASRMQRVLDRQRSAHAGRNGDAHAGLLVRCGGALVSGALDAQVVRLLLSFFLMLVRALVVHVLMVTVEVAVVVVVVDLKMLLVMDALV